jgi:hypothetical protein
MTAELCKKLPRPRHGGEDRGEGVLFVTVLFTPHPDLLPSRGEGTLNSTALTSFVSAKSGGCQTDTLNCHGPLVITYLLSVKRMKTDQQLKNTCKEKKLQFLYGICF